MLKPVRVDAGLGDQTLEYKNNDHESVNFIIKHGLHAFKCETSNVLCLKKVHIEYERNSSISQWITRKEVT